MINNIENKSGVTVMLKDLFNSITTFPVLTEVSLHWNAKDSKWRRFYFNYYLNFDFTKT